MENPLIYYSCPHNGHNCSCVLYSNNGSVEQHSNHSNGESIVLLQLSTEGTQQDLGVVVAKIYIVELHSNYGTG